MEQYNEDELVPPNWLDKDFIQMVLQNHEKNDKIVVKFKEKINTNKRYF